MAGFLICDAEGCDGKIENLGALLPEMIGTPCPKCGTNMLTQRDFDDWQRTMGPFVSILEQLREYTEAKKADGEATEMIAVSVHTHNGALTIKAEPLGGTE